MPGCPYPFYWGPLNEFDPLSDFDMTGCDDVWLLDHDFFFLQTVPNWKDGRQEFPSGVKDGGLEGFTGVLQHI